MEMINPRYNTLIDQFQAIAIKHAQASQEGDYETVNKLVEQTVSLIREMWQLGGSRKESLGPLAALANSDDPRVALRAIVYTAELFPEVVVQLHRLSRDQGLAGLGAKYTLDNIKEGKLRVLKEILGI